MMVPASIQLSVCVMTLALGFFHPMHSHTIEQISHKSFPKTKIPPEYSQQPFIGFQQSRSSSKEYAATASDSPVDSQESTSSAQEASSSFRKTSSELQKEPVFVRKSSVGYQQPIINPQPSSVYSQKSTSSLKKGIASSKVHNVNQESTPSFVSSTDSSLTTPSIYYEYTRQNILLRVKRQRRRRPYRGGGGSGYGRPTKFCNQFGCNSNYSRNPRCPSGTRLNRKSNRCQRLSRG